MAQKIIYIYYKQIEEKSQSAVVNDLYWYDYSEKDIKKRMKKYKGSTMSFEYDYKNKKTKPKTIDFNVTKIKKIDNKKQILDWVHKNEYFLRIHSVDSDNEKVFFVISDSDLSITKSVLENLDFEYEVI